MRLKYKVEFPCGYKLEVDAKDSIFDSSSISGNIQSECPLHGKDCKRGTQK